MATRIEVIGVAIDLPEDQQPTFEYLSTESETFARYAEARANRRDPFFIAAPGQRIGWQQPGTHRPGQGHGSPGGPLVPEPAR
ncbi:MAG: hypothetical protein SVX28_05515, partial [Pseudomonadota bacterium]|nr:hypothetical protein [Pseudomonadota bacterium]